MAMVAVAIGLIDCHQGTEDQEIEELTIWALFYLWVGCYCPSIGPIQRRRIGSEHRSIIKYINALSVVWTDCPGVNVRKSFIRADFASNDGS
jgi:hypothetical protein